MSACFIVVNFATKKQVEPFKNDTTMKQFYVYTTMVLMTMAVITSCEPIEELEDWEDRQEARTLDGTWTGSIKTYYYDRWGLTGNNYRTTMYFERETPYSGWGYEVDYDTRSRYSDYYYCEFRWEVFNGVIRLRYADSWNDVFISDYSLSDYYFDGYMDDGTNADIMFRLSYDSRFDWGYWRNRNYTRGSNDGSSCMASGQFAGAEVQN